jgi:starch phosphorylase
MAFRNVFVYPRYPENLERLYRLAYNLWSTWNYEAIRLFYRVDASLFQKVKHNPVMLLMSLSQERIDELSHDDGFLFELNGVWENYQEYMSHTETAEQNKANALCRERSLPNSQEFGQHECMPLYWAAGTMRDYLKAASDMALPIIGVA